MATVGWSGILGFEVGLFSLKPLDQTSISSIFKLQLLQDHPLVDNSDTTRSSISMFSTSVSKRIFGNPSLNMYIRFLS
jgi:hypothetical protein